MLRDKLANALALGRPSALLDLIEHIVLEDRQRFATTPATQVLMWVDQHPDQRASYKTIADACGISPHTARYALTQNIRDGRIEQTPHIFNGTGANYSYRALV